MKDTVENILNNDGIIVIDTNVYLNIYDRSPEFSAFSISVLESIKDKIILPATVKREFLKNYKTCYNRQIKKVEKACDKLQAQLDSTKQKLHNQCAVIKNFQFPDIDELQVRIFEKIDEAISIINDYGAEHDVLEFINTINIRDNKVYDFVSWLIDNGQALSEFSADELYAMALEASKRYNDQTPPGFRDQKKDEGLEKYGDYFIWKQTLNYAKKNGKSIIFVTDDLKTDWFESCSGIPKFHHLLEEEFLNEVGTSFVGLNSVDFFNIIAEFNGIEKSSAVVFALEYSSDDYIQGLVDEEIIYDNLEKLIYSSEQYVDMDSLSASATEGLEISDEIEDADFVGYEIGEITDTSATYFLTYNIKAEAKSYEYYGRDSDTKEVISSQGRVHKLEGKVVLQVERNIDECFFDVNDCTYENAFIVYGNLKEISAYDVDSLCVQCGKNVGEYQNYYGEPICESCMVVDTEGEICTLCGRKTPIDFMYDEHRCYDCAKDSDD